ncbi:Putative Holin-X, holin superfamily III [Methylophilus rhizosphaerae]|uniref:Putative Holin-X, holin superfamily III n=1 Tax=Methylophilus rhizosphaerae TaxID=492660 RepID=A0A1G9BTE5_9PROT|nr:phage holin family protein [Methylophilus rhizosphaerae]SDK42580.1 Putative Holin-X, holin superfamily III [Methylophilus rhizosphaerae]
MWVNLLKFAAILFFNRKVTTLTDNLLHLREHAADYAESRAYYLKQDFLEETERMATSVVGILVVFSMFIFTGLLGLMWLFSLLWQHPHRSLILGLVMLVPVLVGVLAFLAVRKLWKKKPLFDNSLAMISQDWRLFRTELTPSGEAPENTPASAPDTDTTSSATR